MWMGVASSGARREAKRRIRPARARLVPLRRRLAVRLGRGLLLPVMALRRLVPGSVGASIGVARRIPRPRRAITASDVEHDALAPEIVPATATATRWPRCIGRAAVLHNAFVIVVTRRTSPSRWRRRGPRARA